MNSIETKVDSVIDSLSKEARTAVCLHSCRRLRQTVRSDILLMRKMGAEEFAASRMDEVFQDCHEDDYEEVKDEEPYWEEYFAALKEALKADPKSTDELVYEIVTKWNKVAHKEKFAELGISEAKASASINRLVKKGYLQIDRRGVIQPAIVAYELRRFYEGVDGPGELERFSEVSGNRAKVYRQLHRLAKRLDNESARGTYYEVFAVYYRY